MYLKIFYICAILNIGLVRCDCGDIYSCLGDFVKHFGDIDKNSTKFDVIDISNISSMGQDKVFHVTDLEKSLSDVLGNASNILKQEIEDKVKVVSESDVFVTTGNDTEILVKTFDLDDMGTEDTNFLMKMLQDAVASASFDLLESINQDFVNNTNNLTKTNSENTVTDNLAQDSKSDDSVRFSTVHKLFDEDPLENLQINTTPVPDSEPLQPPNLDTIPSNQEVVNIEYQSAIQVQHIDIDATTSKNAYLPLQGNVPSNTNIIRNISLEPMFENNEYQSTESTNEIDKASTSGNTYLPKVTLANEVTTNPSTFTKAETPTTKRNILKDLFNVKVNEVDLDDTYYEIIDDNSTDYPIIDYIEMYKDTTNEEVSYILTENYEEMNEKNDLDILDNTIEYSNVRNWDNGLQVSNDTIEEAYPWVAAIFVKNGSSSQFEYHCDGAVLSDRAILTSARCVTTPMALDASSFITILGKKSLLETNADERVHRVKHIKLHENFKNENGSVENDLAVLQLEEPVVWNDAIRPACLNDDEGDFVEAATTGWSGDGKLTPIRFDLEKTKTCQNAGKNTFCATYGNDEITCPSHGGIYLERRNLISDPEPAHNWCVRGIRTSDPADRPFCTLKTVQYTHTDYYVDWIKRNMNV